MSKLKSTSERSTNILTIIIPHYNEPANTILPLLWSISNQKGLHHHKTEVILVNDGGADFSDNEYNTLNTVPNLNLTHLNIPHGGPGVARQAGLNNASGKYIMFCDSDDILHNAGILGGLIHEAETNSFDVVTTPWLEETVVNGAKQYHTHTNEMTWIHGKLFRRAFLQYNEIKHHPSLCAHEDTFFLSILADYKPNIGHLNVTSCVWCHRDGSITRKDNAIYAFESMGTFVFSVIESIKWLIERTRLENIEYKVNQLLVYIYLITQSKLWRDESHKDHLAAMEKSLTDNMTDELWAYYHNTPEEVLVKIFNEEYVKSVRDFPVETFADWVDRINS